ncbi:MAG: hypothetical protein PVH25_13970 [Burkholderiales bacterium]|jgi:hypothetical protein
MRLVAVAVMLLAAVASAHDLITAELAEDYLNKATMWHGQAESDADQARRAEAYLHLGVMLDEIRALLNRDLAVHGEVRGLASNYLVAELERTGTPLSYSESRNYFSANSGYYRTALELGLRGESANQARLGLLKGEFYDSFGVDPLDASQSPRQLREQLMLADTLLDNGISEPDLEEVRFIATILYARAARSALQAGPRQTYREQALARAAAFERAYPDSMRSAAMPVVRQALADSQ